MNFQISEDIDNENTAVHAFVFEIFYENFYFSKVNYNLHIL